MPSDLSPPCGRIADKTEQAAKIRISPSAIERLPGEPTRAVVWRRSAGFEGAQVWRPACEILVNRWNQHPGVDGFAGRAEGAAKILGAIDGVALGGVRRPQVCEAIAI